MHASDCDSGQMKAMSNSGPGKNCERGKGFYVVCQVLETIIYAQIIKGFDD